MTVVRNEIRRGVYLDSVALMRIARALEERAGVVRAALMIGTPSNRRLMEEAGLLTKDAADAAANDLVIAIAAENASAAEAALAAAADLLAGGTPASLAKKRRPRSLAAALEAMPDATLALVSVPGAFAVGEARAALRRGLNVMIFSDNVAVEDERALKEEARRRGLLVMGPDCGTALVGGAPLGFANAVPAGDVGIVGASGTGMQEVMCLLARLGKGVSHALGTGGRDLSEAVGGISMLSAIDYLDRDPATRQIVLVSKPPSPAVAQRLLERVAASGKRFTLCFLGLDGLALPQNAAFAATLHEAAEQAAGGPLERGPASPRARGEIRGLFAGGTLCAEAQLVLRRAGLGIASNAPVPGAEKRSSGAGHILLDLGADEYTLGRPHPMIEPAVRTPHLAGALDDPAVGLVLLDVVLGWGGHSDPAGAVVETLQRSAKRKPVIASVCGTDADPQNRAAQVAKLEAVGVVVAPSNAGAAELAVAALK